MSTAIQFLRSAQLSLRPSPTTLSDGMPMLNFNPQDPGLFFKASDNSLFKIGPVSVSDFAPNSSPSGYMGNSIGELWFDTVIDPSNNRPREVLKIWDGTQWRGAGGNIHEAELPQAKNTVLAGPLTGADAVPTFRSLEDEDIPYGIDPSKLDGGTQDGELLIGGSGGWDSGFLTTSDNSLTYLFTDHGIQIDVTAGNIAGNGTPGNDYLTGDGYVQLNYNGKFTGDARFKFLTGTGTLRAYGPTELGQDPLTDFHIIKGDTTISGDVEITDLYGIAVGGDMAVGHDVDLGTTAADALTVYSTSTFNSNVTVAAGSDLLVTGDFEVNQDAILGTGTSNTLTVNSTTTINAPTTIGRNCGDALLFKGTGQFECDLTLDQDLTVNGDTSLNGNVDMGVDCTSLISVKGTQHNKCDVLIGSTLPAVNGETFKVEAATGNTTVSGTLDVSGRAQFEDSLGVGQQGGGNYGVEIDNAGNITALDTITAAFFIGDGSQLSNLAVPNTMLFHGDIDATSAQPPANPLEGDFYLNNTTGTVVAGWPNIGGQAVVENQFIYYATAGWFLGSIQETSGFVSIATTQTITGQKTFANLTTFDGQIVGNDHVRFNSTLTVQGHTQLNNTLTVADGKKTTLGGDLQVKQNSLLNGNLTVQGDTRLGVDCSQTLTVDSAAQFNCDLTIGSAPCSGNFTVWSPTTINCPTTINSTLNVTGNVVLGTNCGGNTILLKGVTTINCATYLKSTLEVDGNTQLKGTLTVTGTTQLNNHLTVADGKNTTLGNNLLVKGNETVNGTSLVKGKTTLFATKNCANDALLVNGKSVFECLVTMNAGLTVTAGNVNIAGNVVLGTTCTNTLVIKSTTTIQCATTISNTLTVSGNHATTLGGTLTVAGNTQVNGTFTVANNKLSKLGGNTEVNGNLYPRTTGSRNIGTAALEFNNVFAQTYTGIGSVLYTAGNNQVVTLRGGGTGSTVVGNQGSGTTQFRTSIQAGYRFYKEAQGTIFGSHKYSALTANREYTWQNKGGTVALTSDLTTYTHLCIQTGGNNTNPSIRLGGQGASAGTNQDVQIVGANGVVSTRNSNSQLTLTAKAANNTITINANGISVNLPNVDTTYQHICQPTGGNNTNPYVSLIAGGRSTGTQAIQMVGSTGASVVRNSNTQLTVTGTRYAQTCIQTGGNNTSPAIRMTASGATTGNQDITLNGSNSVSVTRQSNTSMVFAVKRANNTISENASGIFVNAGVTDTVTSGSCVQTAGNNANPAIRFAKTGRTTGNVDIIHTGSNGVTVTRTSNTAMTFAAKAANNTIGINANGIYVNPGNLGITSANNGQINFNAGNGLSQAGANATSNQSGNTTKTFTVKNANNTIGVNANGVFVNPGNLGITSANNGQINFNAGNGLSQTGTNASANQTGNTTKTFTVKNANNTIGVNANGVFVNPANLGITSANNGQINFNAGNGLSQAGANATSNQSGNTTKTFTVKNANNTIGVNASGVYVNPANVDTVTKGSIQQVGGSNNNPVIRFARTGRDAGNQDLKIVGGTNVTVTRNSATQLTISATGGTTTPTTTYWQAGGGGIQPKAANQAVVPNGNANLGTTSNRWNNLYTKDLHLSNEGKEGGNDVDGTWGDWTIQEGEDSLYVINNRSGQKFKMALMPA